MCIDDSDVTIIIPYGEHMESLDSNSYPSGTIIVNSKCMYKLVPNEEKNIKKFIVCKVFRIKIINLFPKSNSLFNLRFYLILQRLQMQDFFFCHALLQQSPQAKSRLFDIDQLLSCIKRERKN